MAAGPRTAEASSTTADSPASASRASTADSVCRSPTSGRSTTSRRCYEMPIILNTPTFTICAATILDIGSEEQKREHISAALRGDEVLVQLLSEPSGGSDLAGVITRADRQRRQVGDQRRQDLEHQRVRRRLRADAGPHRLGRAQARGPDDVPGADQQPRASRCAGSSRSTAPSSSARSSSTTSNSATTPSSARSTTAGTWRRGSCTTSAARSAAARSSPAASAPRARPTCRSTTSRCWSDRARPTTSGCSELAGRALVHRAVQEQLIDHVYHGVLDGSLPPTAGTIIRISHAETIKVEFDTALAITGSAGVVDDRRRPDSASASATCPARPPRSAAAPPRSPATSSANGCWASRASTPPTAACRSIRSSATAS